MFYIRRGLTEFWEGKSWGKGYHNWEWESFITFESIEAAEQEILTHNLQFSWIWRFLR